MAKSLQNCGDIREFLSNVAIGVKNGDMKADDARIIIKAVEKINENYYAEIKVGMTQAQLGRTVAELGKLPINGADKA